MSLPPLPKEPDTTVTPGFVDAVVDYVQRQESFNENILELLKLFKSKLVSIERRVTALETIAHTSSNVSPLSKDNLH
jgi:hypothetical protein